MQKAKMSNYKYCPYCKEPLKRMPGGFICGACHKKFYTNSSPAASILIVKQGQVLLAVRGKEPKKGAYDVVGGFLELDEHPEAGITREVKEETGLTVKIIGLLGIYIGDDYKYQGEYVHTLNLYYIGKILSGRLKANDDISSLKWFPITKPPKMAFAHQTKLMRDLIKWYQSSRGAGN